LLRFGTRQLDRARDLGEDLSGYVEDHMTPVVRSSHWLRQKIWSKAS
jgi:hypothetical protein